MISRTARLFSLTLAASLLVATIGCSKPVELRAAEVALSVDKQVHDRGAAAYVTVKVTNPNAAELVVAPLTPNSVKLYAAKIDAETGAATPVGRLRFVEDLSGDQPNFTLAAGASDDRTFQIEALPAEAADYDLYVSYKSATHTGQRLSSSNLVRITIE